MNPAACIREFSFEEDYDRVLTLWKSIEVGMQVERSDTPEEIKRKIDRDSDLFLVAEVRNEIIGTIIGGFDGRRGMIYHLAVQREMRKQGIGAALLAKVEERLQAKGCLKVYLLVVDDNLPAMRFYEECGWTQMKHDLVFAKEF
ncbi:MAG: GNAT family acetyltransferase [Anaerolineales bacterium]|uniref:GNAT family acetyltransferase n=1 Tax=Candidatus Villigracilis vicinus TaxID=3140679 RepID=UPI00313520D0|nr:GNAT family acetyltransferase [Anaerolineales bacterium]